MNKIRRHGTADDPMLGIRAPQELIDLLDRAAEQTGRSRSREALDRLATSFERPAEARPPAA